MITVVSIVAVGAGLHVAALYIEHEGQIGPVATVLAVAVPLAIYTASIYALYYYLVRRFDTLHVWLVSGTLAVMALAVIAAAAGLDMAVALLILMLAPVVTVVGYEAAGHRHQAAALATEDARAAE
jgi:hypothetical protein